MKNLPLKRGPEHQGGFDVCEGGRGRKTRLRFQINAARGQNENNIEYLKRMRRNIVIMVDYLDE